MSGFNGKWRIVKQENLEAYHEAIHTPAEYRAKLLEVLTSAKETPDSYVEELFVDKASGKARRTVFIRGEKKRESDMPIGQETQITAADGRPVQITVKLPTDTQIRVHEKGPDFEANVVMDLAGNELTLTLTSGGVTAKQIYNRI